MFNNLADDVEVYADSKFIGKLGDAENLEKNPGENKTIELTAENNTLKIAIDVGNGINAEIIVTKGYHMLVFGSNLPADFKGNINGLQGNFDDDPENEFINRNGTLIPDNATEEAIFYEFGQSWKVHEGETLFTYNENSNRKFEYYANVTHYFKPIFLDKYKNESLMVELFDGNDKLMGESKEACLSKPKQIYYQCMYDSAQTGDANSGAATGNIYAAAVEQKEMQGMQGFNYVIFSK